MSAKEDQTAVHSEPVELDHGPTLLDVAPKLEKPWFMYPRLLQLNFLLLGSLLAQVTCGYDGSSLNGLQSVSSWNKFFNNPAGSKLGTIVNGMTIGSLIMTPFVTYIVDYLGRRWSNIIGCFIIVIGALIQGLAKNVGMFMGGRILLGVGGIISLTACPPLITECGFPSQRPVLTALLMPSWPFGALIAALVTWAPYMSMQNNNWAWRIPSLIQLALPCVQIVLAFFGPESPRYLISIGRESEARDFFIKYHAFGDATHPIVEYEMAEITAAIEEEKLNKVGSWLTWFSSRSFIHIFCLCIIVPSFQQLAGNSVISVSIFLPPPHVLGGTYLPPTLHRYAYCTAMLAPLDLFNRINYRDLYFFFE
ncbi:hexose transporter HXT11 [Sugiyamaella lignohabitans]|uniref:Hexose transporter HXT11 n=1 Tax=Sugiyamaella lignohabitans TaxID=796027 RepID=A0A167D1B0_9ASCO|nr:hexose transporter HXT11 [Sugiyamaella lignohabitans]ANB12356.1 hexose transporter HXT11 [Sugiyamaella lignohabitans]